MGRGRGVARREGGAQQAGPHPLTRAHAHPPNAHNPRDGLADPHPSRAPRARRRTARSVPGSREEVGDHAHARTRAAARRGRRSPTPRGDPDVRAASERRTAVPGPGDSRARAAAAPAHASGRGPGPGRGPAPSPAGGRGRRGGARHSTAKGKATEAGRRARPARDGGPGPGPRAPGRAPPPGPGGRASDRPGGGRPSHTSHEHLPGRDHRAALGRTHAPNGATPRGERTGLSPPGWGGAARRPDAEERAGTRRDAGRGRRPSGEGGRRGTPPAQSTATRTHAGVSPPAASEHEGGPAWHLERPTRPSAIPAAPPPPRPLARGQSPRSPLPPTRTARPTQTLRAPTGPPPTWPRRRAPWGYADTGPTSVAGGGDAPRRRSRVRAQTGRPTA